MVGWDQGWGFWHITINIPSLAWRMVRRQIHAVWILLCCRSWKVCEGRRYNDFTGFPPGLTCILLPVCKIPATWEKICFLARQCNSTQISIQSRMCGWTLHQWSPCNLTEHDYLCEEEWEKYCGKSHKALFTKTLEYNWCRRCICGNTDLEGIKTYANMYFVFYICYKLLSLFSLFTSMLWDK